MLGILNNKIRLSGSDVVLPVSKLAIGTTSAVSQLTIVQSDVSTTSGIALIGPDGHGFGLNYNGSGLAVTEAGTIRMLLQNGGNIGVGVSSAQAGFHIGSDLRVDGNFTVNGSLTKINTNATVTHMLSISNDGTGPALLVRQTGAQPAMDVYDDATLALRVADGGHVGINTSSPTEWLDVAGNIRSSGFVNSAYTIATGPAATLTAAIANSTPGAILSWNRNADGAVCLANFKGTLSGGWEFVSYDANAEYKQVCMTLNDGGDVQIAGTGSILGNMFLAGNSSLSGTVVTLSNLDRTGPTYSMGGPHENIYTTNDPYPVYQKLVWGHDNISIGFDTYFDGAHWLSGDTSTAFQIVKLNSNFLIRPSVPANIQGAPISWSSAGLIIDSAGRVGINATPSQMLDVGGHANVLNNLSVGGTVSSQVLNASATNITGLVVSGSVSTSNLYVAGQSSLSGGLWVGSHLDSAVVNASTCTTSWLNVIGPASLSDNLMVSAGTITSSALITSQRANFGGLLTNNIFGSLLLRCYDEDVYYKNTTPVPGTALPAAFLSKPNSQSQISSIDLTAFRAGTLDSNFSARISGYIQSPSTGTFTFRTTYQDGATIWLSTTKILDAWSFQGSTTQALSSSIILKQNMWIPLSIEHAVAGGPEKLLIEWNFNGGSFTTLSHTNDGLNFRFAYDLYEIEPTLFGTSYFAGRVSFNDTAYLEAGASLPNASAFTGNISELTNDAGFIASSRPTLSSVSINNYASISGTLVAAGVGINQPSPQFTLDVGGNINFSGSLYKGGSAYISSQWTSAGSTLYFTGGKVGIEKTNPQFTLDVGGNINFSGDLYKGGSAYISSQWTSAGSNLYFIGSNVGLNTSNPQATLDVAGSVVATTLGITGAASVSGVFTNRVLGSLLMRTFDESGLYVAYSLSSGNPLPPACMGRPYSDAQLMAINLSNQVVGTLSAFSLRIAGHIKAPQTGTYLFRTTARDGASLYIYSQKITDNWVYTGSTVQSVGTLTMYQNMWTPIIVEHTASSSATEQLLIEWSNNAGTSFSILGHGSTTASFRFGYDSGELPITNLGSMFVGGKANFTDTGAFYKGVSLPNASGFTGNTSQLTNDAGFVSNFASMGTISGTVLNILQSATISGNVSVGGEFSNNVSGSLTMRVYDDSGLYALSTMSNGSPLRAPFTSRPYQEQQIGSLSFSNASFGSLTAYSLRIIGYIQPPSTGTYLLRSTYKNGLSLYISQQKIVDSWTFSGSSMQSVGTLTLYQNVWYGFAAEHAASSSLSQTLLIEWCQPGGTFTTMNNTNFVFAYDMKEFPPSLFGTSYTYGHANFQDVANFLGGVSLPNATLFSGNTSELNNDSGFVKTTGTLSLAALSFTGTTGGTLIQLINKINTVSGSVSTSAFAALGVSPGTALDNYAMTSHRWWTGSTGTTSGSVSMQLSNTNLMLTGNLAVTGSITQSGNQLYYASYLAAASNNFSFPANGYQVPKSFWSYVSSAYSNGDLMATDGTITFPASGIYTLTYAIQIVSSAGNTIASWIQASSSSSPYYSAPTRMALSQVASSSATQNLTGSFTGYFASSEKVFLWVFGPASASFSGGAIANYFSLTGRTP